MQQNAPKQALNILTVTKNEYLDADLDPKSKTNL